MRIPCAVKPKSNGRGSISHRLQFGSKSFYDFLLVCGLHPNKSRSLGEINVPKEHFAPFFRGIIDGDGCIRKWQYPGRKYFQRYFKITAGSKRFLDWLNSMLAKIFGSTGPIYLEDSVKSSAYVLKIGKRNLVGKIFCACYQNDGVALPRKKAQALEFLNHYPARVAEEEYAADLKSAGS